MVKPSSYLIRHVCVLGWRLQEHYWMIAVSFFPQSSPTAPFHLTVRCLGLPDLGPWHTSTQVGAFRMEEAIIEKRRVSQCQPTLMFVEKMATRTYGLERLILPCTVFVRLSLFFLSVLFFFFLSTSTTAISHRHLKNRKGANGCSEHTRVSYRRSQFNCLIILNELSNAQDDTCEVLRPRYIFELSWC
jgi:hypothetical protein